MRARGRRAAQGGLGGGEGGGEGGGGGGGGAPLLLPLVMTPVIGIRMEYVGGGTLQDMVERRVELLQQQPGIEGPGREGKEGGGALSTTSTTASCTAS